MCRVHRTLFFPVLTFCLVAVLSGSAGAPQDTQWIERDRFILSKFSEPVGEETYEISRRQGDVVTVRSKFSLHYLGGDVALETTLRAQPDQTPLHYEVKGDTSTQTQIDASVEVRGATATVRHRGQTRDVVVPAQFFPTTGYAPIAMQMQLLRYWASRGRPARLTTLPEGEVTIELRGRDTIRLKGKSEALNRYSVGGLIWGRQTVWTNAAGSLVAVVTVDDEFDHFEAVREAYKDSLPFFVRRAAEDAVVTLERLSRPVPPMHSGDYAIVGAAVVMASARAPIIEDATVLVRKGRITAVGPRSLVTIPKGLPQFDARGMTLLPGLWDMHAHYVSVEWGPAMLAAGITTARDCANDFDFITRVRETIRRGRGLGPRLLLAGYVDGPGRSGLGSVRAATPEEGRAIVRRYHQAAFEQIKIYGTGEMKREVVAAIIEEAHRLGMTVTGHIPRGMNAREAVEAGFDQINHLGFLFPLLRPPAQAGSPPPINLDSEQAQRAIAFFKEKGTVIEPTFARLEMNTKPLNAPFDAEPGAAKVPRELADVYFRTGVAPDVAQRVRGRIEVSYRVLRALHQAGIPIVPGIDLAIPGHSLHRELEHYVAAGLTPMEALQTATIVSARAMRLDGEVGTVEAGKRADLILVAGRPHENIRDLRNVRYVVTQGRLYESAPLWRSVGFQP